MEGKPGTDSSSTGPSVSLSNLRPVPVSGYLSVRDDLLITFNGKAPCHCLIVLKGLVS